MHDAERLGRIPTRSGEREETVPDAIASAPYVLRVLRFSPRRVW